MSEDENDGGYDESEEAKLDPTSPEAKALRHAHWVEKTKRNPAMTIVPDYDARALEFHRQQQAVYAKRGNALAAEFAGMRADWHEERLKAGPQTDAG